MNIRIAQWHDLEKLVPLFEGYRHFYRKSPDNKAAHDFLKDRLLERDSVIFIAEDNQEDLTGFTQLYPLFSSTKMKRLWLLNDLYVEANHRGQGISKLLIDKAKSWVHTTNACGLLLETEVTNHIGNKLYPASGFQKVDTSYFYEWNP